MWCLGNIGVTLGLSACYEETSSRCHFYVFY
uniref:Uncharacterized protein n=1 Tax=Anguilla anguilla TaxID=7936 RepID=A0A0E9T250_ANGAN